MKSISFLAISVKKSSFEISENSCAFIFTATKISAGISKRELLFFLYFLITRR